MTDASRASPESTGPEPADDGRHPIERLVEEFLDRTQRGENPTIEDYAQAWPDLADEIREVFPAIVAVERLKSDSHGLGTSTFGSGSGVDAPAIENLGDYRILGVLGRGGMGVVYEAEQVTLGRRVAVKLLPRDATADPKRMQRFEREARTAAALHHTNIVPIFGSGECDGHVFYVMQRIEGVGLDLVVAALRGNAEDAIARGRSSSVTRSRLETVLDRLGVAEHDGSEPATPRQLHPDRIAKIGTQLAQALDYAHAQGVMHRDIKPANVLLDEHCNAWITDFGLAKALEQPELTQPGDLIGTLRYLAPEQLEGAFDVRTEIHALGVTLFELATGQHRYDGSNRAELVAKIAARDPAASARLRPDLPLDLTTIIDKCCAAAPEDRYESAAQVGDDLERFLAGEPIHARRTAPIEVVWRWCKRNRLAASLAAVAVAALAIATTAGLLGWILTTQAYREESKRAGEAEEARAHTAANLALSLEAFEAVFREICGPERVTSAVSESDDGTESVVVAATPVSSSELAVLQKLLAFYEEFARRNADVPEIAWDLVVAQRRVGDIQQRIGALDAARAAYENAKSRFAELPREVFEKLDGVLRQRELATIHNELGNVLVSIGSPREALTSHRAALDALREIPEADRAEEVRFDEARTQIWIGLAMGIRPGGRAPGEGPGGERGPGGRRGVRGATRVGPGRPGPNAAFEAALTTLDALLETSPRNADYRFARARALRFVSRGGRGEGRYGQGSRPTGRPTGRPTERPDAQPSDAEPDWRRALAIQELEELVRDHPEAPAFRGELALTLLEGSERDRLRGRIGRRPGPEDPPTPRALDPERRAELDRAHALLTKLEAESPGVAFYAAPLATAEDGLAHDDWAADRAAEALVRIQRCRALRADLARHYPDVHEHLAEWSRAVQTEAALTAETAGDVAAHEILVHAVAELASIPAGRTTRDGQIRGGLLMRLGQSYAARGEDDEARALHEQAWTLLRRRRPR